MYAASDPTTYPGEDEKEGEGTNLVYDEDDDDGDCGVACRR